MWKQMLTETNLQWVLSLLLLGGNGWVDLRKKQIWPLLTLALALSGWALLLWRGLDPLPYLAGMGIGAMLLILALLSQGGVGLGDGLVVMGLGCLLPWEEVLLSLLFALGLTSLFAILLLLRKKSRKTQIPFLPFLFVGGLLTLALKGWS